MTAWRCQWLLGILLVAATVVAYQPVWRAGFVWDDDEFLTDKPTVKSVDLKSAEGLRQVWFTAAPLDYYPMTDTMWWLELRLWGNHPFGYHLANVLLHALAAVWLWRALVCLRIPGALLAAGIFALHPVNVESVAWISEGKNTLAMFFFTATLWCWTKFVEDSRRLWHGLALVLFAFALLSKAAVAPLPVVLLGIAWGRRGRVGWPDVRRVLPFFLMAGAVCCVTIWFHYHRAIGQAVVRTDGFWSRLAGAGWAVWFYLYKAVLPINLAFVYPRWRIDPSSAWTYIPLLLLTLVFVACWRSRQSWGRAAFFALAYFVVMLLPVAGFLNIFFMMYSLVADHWQYFAIIGPISLAAAFIRRPVPAAVLLLALGALTWRQCQMYSNDETLWLKTLRLNPGCWMARNNLGIVYSAQGRPAEAMAQYKKALQIKPDYAEAHNNLAMLFKGEGKWDDATRELLAALQSRPQYDEAHYNLGLIYLDQHRVDDAIAQFRAALQINPRYDKAFANLGIALAEQGHLDQAIEQYRQAIALAPDNAYAQNALGRALEDENKLTEAAAHYAAAVTAKPDFAEAHENLGAVLTMLGKVAPADGQLRQALKLQPASSSIHYNLGNNLVRENRLRDAVFEYGEAVRLRPSYLDAHFNLALVLAQLGRTNDAIGEYREALRLNPSQDLAKKIQERLDSYRAHRAP